MKIFFPTKKLGRFFTLFWSKIWPFLLKNEVFGHFLRNRASDLSETWSETVDNCFESSNGSGVSRKILVLAVFGHFWVKNALLVVALYGFGLFLAIFFQTVDDFFFNFLHEVVSPYNLDDHHKIFWSKKILTTKMAKNGQNLAFFGQNSHFWVFLAYIFQTPL